MFELHVEGMTCGGCANRVKRSLQAIDNAATVHVDLTRKTVEVETAAGIDDVRAAVTGAGYPVTACREV
jgi:copper chaperone CopZ